MVGEHDARMKAARDAELWIKQGPEKQLKTDELWITRSKAKDASREPTAEERAALEYREAMKRAILGDPTADSPPPAENGLRRGELDGLRPQTIAPAVGPPPEATARSGSGSPAVATPAFQPAWRTTPAGSAPAASALPPSPWSSPSASPAASALTVPAPAPVIQDRPMSTRPFEPVRTDRR